MCQSTYGAVDVLLSPDILLSASFFLFETCQTNGLCSASSKDVKRRLVLSHWQKITL